MRFTICIAGTATCLALATGSAAILAAALAAGTLAVTASRATRPEPKRVRVSSRR